MICVAKFDVFFCVCVFLFDALYLHILFDYLLLLLYIYIFNVRLFLFTNNRFYSIFDRLFSFLSFILYVVSILYSVIYIQ